MKGGRFGADREKNKQGSEREERRGGKKENVSAARLSGIPLCRAASISFVKSASFPASQTKRSRRSTDRRRETEEAQCVSSVMCES